MNEFKEGLKSKNVTYTPLSEREARRVYEEFVIEQEKQFILFINYLNKYINKLRDLGKITPYLTFYARVKSTISAYKNHLAGKTLDDIFGLEILATSEDEYKTFMKEIESSPEMINLLKVHSMKSLDKENGYKAEHHTCSIEPVLINFLISSAEKTTKQKMSKQSFPLLEFHFMTFENFYKSVYGSASHEKYKNTKIEQIQSLYDAGILTVGEYIPAMWKSNPYSDEVIELSSRDILKKMFPSLKLKDSKNIPENKDYNPHDER